jgi:2-C-methyl-D-erythritol 2,4-cyclodiphosphate synthase
MRENVANALCVDVDCVNIKATTEEKLGFTGRKEGISSHCVCLIEK